jgi:hypothetical protein
MSLRSAFDALLAEVHLPNEGVRDRIRDEVEHDTDVPPEVVAETPVKEGTTNA